MRWDTCRDPGVDQNLTITDAPSTSSFFEYWRGVERTDLSSCLRSYGILYSLKGRVEMPFRTLSFSGSWSEDS